MAKNFKTYQQNVRHACWQNLEQQSDFLLQYFGSRSVHSIFARTDFVEATLKKEIFIK
jgi:hypothetical protein